MDRYESPLGLEDEHYRLIGIIAAHWERLEFVLEVAVAEVGSHDPINVGLLTANIGFQPKIDLVLTYARMLEDSHPAEFKMIKKALSAIKKAYVLRNTYVHARWLPPKMTGRLERSVVRTRGGKLNIGNIETTIPELTKAASDIWSAQELFAETLQGYGLLRFKSVGLQPSP